MISATNGIDTLRRSKTLIRLTDSDGSMSLSGRTHSNGSRFVGGKKYVNLLEVQLSST